MSEWTVLDRFLQTDPRDVGCEQAMEILHVYVEMIAVGDDAEERIAGCGGPSCGVRALQRGLPRSAGRGARRELRLAR